MLELPRINSESTRWFCFIFIFSKHCKKFEAWKAVSKVIKVELQPDHERDRFPLLLWIFYIWQVWRLFQVLDRPRRKNCHLWRKHALPRGSVYEGTGIVMRNRIVRSSFCRNVPSLSGSRIYMVWNVNHFSQSPFSQQGTKFFRFIITKRWILLWLNVR